MTHLPTLLRPTLALALALGALAPVAAQPRSAPLALEGAHQRSTPSAAAVALGGVARLNPDPTLTLLRDPALLGALPGPQLALGATWRSTDRRQVQHYAPVRYYPNLSVLLEGLTDRIPDPPEGTIVFGPDDVVQRPFDTIGPNWNAAARTTAPLQGALAVPLDLGGVRLAAGLAVTEYGDFGTHLQNNNALSPNVFAQRPVPLPRPTDANPLAVDWYQTVRLREGSAWGYGGALALTWPRHGLTVAASGTLVHGTTRDLEQDVARGRLTFFANAFQLDPLPGRSVWSGRSTFSGFDAALGAELQGRHAAIGATARLPMTLTRRFALTEEDSGTTREGTDELRLPWRGTAGVTLTPRPDLAFGVELETRPFARATLRTNGGSAEERPWLSSTSYRFGLQFEPTPWLALRGGLRHEAEPFGAEGRAVETDPVWAVAHTLGVGLAVAGARINLAAEWGRRDYEDVMSAAIHYHRERRLLLAADVTYTLGRGR